MPNNMKGSENLETLISERRIEYYEYSNFKNMQLIGKGSFGSVFRVTWTNTTHCFAALKTFDNDEQTLKQIVKELTLHREVNIHENILRFHGVTNIETDSAYKMKKYSLVLEYADSGTLYEYLKNHFDELDWNDKLRLAFQLASAVECMHCRGVIHRDLHAKNVLVHQKNIKLADFGLSKKIAEESSNPKIFGIIPYIDPKSLNDKQYKLNEKSDIYGIGVLMWQISSGYQPFKNSGYDVKLSIAIVRGLREEIINKTPKEYSNLYKECWKYEPNDRPNIQKVVSALKLMILPKQDDNTVNESFFVKSRSNNDDLFIDSIIDEKSVICGGLQNSKPDRLNIVESESKSETQIITMYANNNSLSNVPIKITNLSRNAIELNLKDRFITQDEKAKEIIKNLTEVKHLYALKLLFEDLKNQFSDQALINSLVALADSTSFNLYYSIESAARLELHLRTLAVVLERVCFSICLTKELQDKVYNSLAKFAEIHLKTIQNNFKPNFDQFYNQDDEKIARKRNYNIDFLLIHLRDTLRSMRDESTWFQKIMRKAKELLKIMLNITPGILLNDNTNYSIRSMLTQLRQGLNFKYPVASYYKDWRIMLIIQNNLFTWSESSEKIISKKLGEMVLMEYLWTFLEREWIDVSDKAILDSQTKFDELSNKVASTLKDTKSFLNNLVGSEPTALPHTLWFGILDLAQNLTQKSTQTSIYGLCYYLAIESLNKAPSSFIQFKAIETLLHLHNIDNQMFSMIEIDFDQYSQKLHEHNLTDSSEKFQNLLIFVKEKYFEDLKILNDNIGKGKGKGKSLEQNTHLKREQISNSHKIIGVIADGITCPISSEPSDQLCVLKCQHILSPNNLNKLKQKACPKCREKIEYNDIRYLPQDTIYKNLYSQFFDAGHILPSIELEDSKHAQYDSDSDNSEVDLILTKKKQFIKAFKLNSNVLLSSILPRISKKQHPTYQNVMKELYERNYEQAEHWCKEFLKNFPKSYSIRCILAYTYRCLNNYEQAHLYLDEAINLRPKHPVAYFIHGEIFFRENRCNDAITNLSISISYKAKINNLYIVLGNSYLFTSSDDKSYKLPAEPSSSSSESPDDSYYYDDSYGASYYYDDSYGASYYYDYALNNYNIALKNDPNNYLCLKNCAHICERQEKYLSTLEILNKLLVINEKDSLILCYYGEILKRLGRYDEAILYFTKANIIDPENVHNLNRRAITYYVLQEYDKALLDFNKVIQLDSLNDIAYYYKGLIYYMRDKTEGNFENAAVAFKKCIELNSHDNVSKMQLYYVEYLQDNNSFNDYDLIKKINQIPNIHDNETLLFTRCKIYIELKQYNEAESDWNRLIHSSIEFPLTTSLLQKYSDFWSYLCEVCKINDDFTELGIFNEFDKYMYKVRNVYFISNLVNLNSELYQFQQDDINSLSGQVLSFKNKLNKELNLSLPIFDMNSFYYSCKINVKKLLSRNCFITFVINYYHEAFTTEEHISILNYEDLSEFEGLGWIEYPISILRYGWVPHLQLSIRISGSIDMQIDHVRFNNSNRLKIRHPKIGHLMPPHKHYPNVPDAFKDKYFPRKEMENLLELKDIINK